MKLAIADPPYLGKADRWYGNGRGLGKNLRRADYHPQAAEWDRPETHDALVDRLRTEYEGWVIALDVDSLPTYLALPSMPPDVMVMSWHKPNALPSRRRVLSMWEPVIAYVPAARRSVASGGRRVKNTLVASTPRAGFAGAKPRAWTLWVCEVLGYDPHTDTIDDLFAGSGAVAKTLDGMLL